MILSKSKFYNNCRNKNLSKILENISSELIGLRMLGSECLLLGFRNIIILACFQDLGKYASRNIESYICLN